MARILAVDDDKDLLNNLKVFLQFESHEVDLAFNGREGWDKLQQEKYDLIILDWQMPLMTGPEICRAFRQGGGITPILLLTGLDSIDDKEAGLDSGADDYLTKPFEMRELGARLRSLIKRTLRLSESESSRNLWKRIDKSFDSEQDPFIGTTIGDKYDVLSLVGLGGMGLVYKARHNVMQRLVALKILLPHLAIKPDVLKRFQQEAESASRLSHPNIVAVYDYGMAARGLPFLAMEFLEGQPLSQIIKTEFPLSLEKCLDIFIQTTRGLEHAHDSRVIHRDLKPGNLMLLPDSTVKILDFGLAKPLAREGQEPEKITQTGFLFGSPEYMSPEQCLALPVDSRSDIYSFGCLMYETLTGAPPFAGSNPIDIMKKQIASVPDRLNAPHIDPDRRLLLESIILKALAKDANARYQSMAGLTAELLKAQNTAQQGLYNRYKTLCKINILRLTAAGSDKFALLKLSLFILVVCLVLACLAGIGFCLLWTIRHPP